MGVGVLVSRVSLNLDLYVTFRCNSTISQISMGWNSLFKIHSSIMFRKKWRGWCNVPVSCMHYIIYSERFQIWRFMLIMHNYLYILSPSCPIKGLCPMHDEVTLHFPQWCSWLPRFENFLKSSLRHY